ncbi:hypothetical protein P7D22_21475 [Lichenihabitans sp. Uapishka_5]|uniref:hypothetical protein n=1 Tax=Lichenihabitans sp. Uapishka_5 TaxID=3037302 RepID=UPI0029E8101F|nr:hypothetical protein [Lichenihabitans sp. Uapishka_5]MDX7953739.1 hypothetical protein [Lichenihabitans sp. Uapishka_5]
MKPFFADLRTSVARHVMRQAAGFVALTAPWLALPSDRRMSRITLVIVAAVLALGLGEAGWLGVELIQVAIHRLSREEVQ